jgi:hypothetical protein
MIDLDLAGMTIILLLLAAFLVSLYADLRGGRRQPQRTGLRPERR